MNSKACGKSWQRRMKKSQAMRWLALPLPATRSGWAAKAVLAGLTLSDLRENPAVPYEEDEVTRIIQDDINETIYNSIRSWTVGELREWLLDIHTTNEMIRKISRGLTSEMIAAVCKLMGNLDLIYAASKIQVTSHCNTTIGLPALFPRGCSQTTPRTIRPASWHP